MSHLASFQRLEKAWPWPETAATKTLLSNQSSNKASRQAASKANGNQLIVGCNSKETDYQTKSAKLPVQTGKEGTSNLRVHCRSSSSAIYAKLCVLHRNANNKMVGFMSRNLIAVTNLISATEGSRLSRRHRIAISRSTFQNQVFPGKKKKKKNRI